MPLHLERVEKELRQAAAGRRYREVTRLAPEFAEAVWTYVQTLPKGDSRTAEAIRRLDDVFSWALVMLQAARSNCLTDLRRVSTANRYSRRYGQPETVAAVQLDA